MLVHLLKSEPGGLVMVFCNTQRTTDFVAHNLKSNGIEAEAIHGGLSQAKRNSIMHHFHSAKVFVLVCTDVAARGLDIKGVSHVYNFDIPKDSKQYVHRIGRTARAGKEGKAVSLLADRDHENFSRVLRDNSVKIIKTELPLFERAQVRIPEPPRREDRQGGGRNRLGRHFRGGRDGDRGGGSRGGGRFGGREERGGSRGGSRHGGPRSHGESRSDSGPRRKGYHEE